MGEDPLVQRAERAVPSGERLLPPAARRRKSRLPMIPVENLLHATRPGDRRLTGVPDESDPSARPKHPGELAKGPLGVEPMERLCADDGIRESIGERDPLRGPIEDRDVGNDPLEDPPHAGGRLDRDESRAEGGERPGELSGTAPEVHDRTGGSDPEDPAEMPHRCNGIPGPTPFVRVGRAVEPANGRVRPRPVRGHRASGRLLTRSAAGEEVATGAFPLRPGGRGAPRTLRCPDRGAGRD